MLLQTFWCLTEIHVGGMRRTRTCFFFFFSLSLSLSLSLSRVYFIFSTPPPPPPPISFPSPHVHQLQLNESEQNPDGMYLVAHPMRLVAALATLLFVNKALARSLHILCSVIANAPSWQEWSKSGSQYLSYTTNKR